VLTTEFVLLEVASAFSSSLTRDLFVRLLPHLRSDPTVEILSATAELFQAGFDLYRRRPDKNWSLTDCISFVVMRDRGLTEALTADRHFDQAGFAILLK
jgi:predicted nucleic acid-binding protein